MKTTAMKTSVVLDQEKVQLAKKLGQVFTIRELLDKALDAYIAIVRRRSVADMIGTGFFEGSLKKMRGRNVGSR